ncbi:MAG TPA: hypothetical protein PLQ93_11380 [Bacteroidia bacterium]|nr:hypothetical protein [Bacteroidia bacterium]
MKRILVIVGLCVSAAVAKAQTNTDEIALLQASYGLEKKQIVTQYMKITDAESSAFWKEYDMYEAERKELGKKRISIITDYANNANNLSDAKATELMKSTLDLYISFAKLQEKTFNKMSKVITPVRAAQFIQLEVYLENVVRMEISDQIPMIGELEKTHK